MLPHSPPPIPQPPTFHISTQYITSPAMSWSDVAAGRVAPGSATPASPAPPTGDVQRRLSSHTPSTDKPNVLNATLCVALMEALRPQKFRSAEAVDIRSTDVDNITYHHGPFTTHPDTNRRVAPFLDALAAVAVAKEKGEVIAVALRLTKSSLELIISGNTTIPPETIEYLHALWGLLRALADVYTKQYTRPNQPGDRDASPPMRREHSRKDPLYNSLHQHIFKFCIAKFRRQFTKYWGKILAFGRNHGAWKRAQSDFVDETQENFERFRRMCQSLEMCAIMLSKLERNPDDNESLNMLVHAMSLAYEIAKIVLNSPTDCETWVSRIGTDNSQRKFCCVSAVQYPCFCCSYLDSL